MITDILAKYESYLRNERYMTDRSVRDYLDFFKILSSRLDILKVQGYKEVNDCIRATKEERGYSQGSVYKMSICVRHIFKWLHRERYREDNPYPFSEWKKPRPSTPKFLTESDFENLIIDPHLTHQETAILYILWDSGARIGEISQLTQDLIDLEKGLVTIPYEISKGHYSYRIVPIGKEAIEALKRQFLIIRRHGHQKAIFLGPNNEPMTVSGLKKLVSKIGMRTSALRGMMRISAHQFRHSFALRHLEKGIPQMIVSKWLGHQNLDMTLRYLNLCSDSSRRVYDQFYQQA